MKFICVEEKSHGGRHEGTFIYTNVETSFHSF
jgi:hypothetical protein